MVELDLTQVMAAQRASVWQEWHSGLFKDRVRLGPPPVRPPLGGSIRGVGIGSFGLYRVRTAFALVRHGMHIELDRTQRESDDQHGHYAVFLLLNGSCTVKQDGRVNRLAAGDIVFVNSGRPFEKEMEIGSELVLFLLPLRLVRAHLPDALRNVNQRFLAGAPGTQMLSRLLISALEMCPLLNVPQCKRLMSMLVEALSLPVLDQDPVSNRDEARMRRAMQHLESSAFDSTFSTEQLAAYMGVSRRRLDEIFVAQLGRPVAPLIWQKRLDRAAELLAASNSCESKVTDIAFDVGFENVSHFSRAFKKHFGCTPMAWREAARKDG